MTQRSIGAWSVERVSDLIAIARAVERIAEERGERDVTLNVGSATLVHDDVAGTLTLRFYR